MSTASSLSSFLENTLIRHGISGNYWYAKVVTIDDEEDHRVLVRDASSQTFETLESFMLAHYQRAKLPCRRRIVLWSECEMFKTGRWINCKEMVAPPAPVQHVSEDSDSEDSDDSSYRPEEEEAYDFDVSEDEYSSDDESDDDDDETYVPDDDVSDDSSDDETESLDDDETYVPDDDSDDETYVPDEDDEDQDSVASTAEEDPVHPFATIQELSVIEAAGEEYIENTDNEPDRPFIHIQIFRRYQDVPTEIQVYYKEGLHRLYETKANGEWMDTPVDVSYFQTFFDFLLLDCNAMFPISELEVSIPCFPTITATPTTLVASKHVILRAIEHYMATQWDM